MLELGRQAATITRKEEPACTVLFAAQSAQWAQSGPSNRQAQQRADEPPTIPLVCSLFLAHWPLAVSLLARSRPRPASRTVRLGGTP